MNSFRQKIISSSTSFRILGQSQLDPPRWNNRQVDGKYIHFGFDRGISIISQFTAKISVNAGEFFSKIECKARMV